MDSGRRSFLAVSAAAAAGFAFSPTRAWSDEPKTPIRLGGPIFVQSKAPAALAREHRRLGYSAAYPRHHDTLILKEALLVAFFLAGLVVLGGQQQWWLQPVLTSMSPRAVFFGATGLTALTDNAALTFLGSLVPGLSDEFKYSLVAGAVTGGGLTVIANAPNPAGFSILRASFEGNVIRAGGLLLGAIGPTLVAVLAFELL